MYYFASTHKECECCGRTNRLQTHHKIPLHVRPELAADPSNMIRLCHWCHLTIGHAGDYEFWVDNIDSIIEEIKKNTRS